MNIRKHIPDSITSMNLLCGVVGVILTLGGRPDLGFLMMILGAVFDFFDGFAARMLKASSGIGKELDSLADMVSFGVLPSVLLYVSGGTNILFLKYFPIILAAFSALRLAKFNLDERQHSSFLGRRDGLWSLGLLCVPCAGQFPRFLVCWPGFPSGSGSGA